MFFDESKFDLENINKALIFHVEFEDYSKEIGGCKGEGQDLLVYTDLQDFPH